MNTPATTPAPPRKSGSDFDVVLHMQGAIQAAISTPQKKTSDGILGALLVDVQTYYLNDRSLITKYT